LNDYYIKQIMQLSEKIDYSYGRRRKRSSIGFYNLSMIKSPIDYKIIDASHEFVPLEYKEKMTLDRILEEHEKGIEFGYIVKGYGHYPILLSADGMTLSLPPVINSNDVGKVTEETNESLIEVTGTNFETVNVVLNILCQVLADHGAEIYSVEIEYPAEILEKNVVTPLLTGEKITFNLDTVNKYLGTSIKPKEAEELIKKRRFDCISVEKSDITIEIPPYRVDILHWVDIAEELVIALDYTKIIPTKWKVLTVGSLLPETESEDLIRNMLIGAGGIEILSNTLTDPEILTSKINVDDEDYVKIENPVSTTYSVLRNQIYPLLINVLSKNTHGSYPQLIFEVGEIVKLEDNEVTTQTNAAFCIADAEASFEDAHKRLHQLMTLLKAEYKIKNIKHPSFTEGRCGRILIDKKECGIIGEIHPSVLETNQIWVPVVGFELELPYIPSLNCKIKHTY
ncbi:MAG: phenylalanine--tRNA ligase subunit beta, partial [Candidatus Heimdallarchaeota archaeon]|nr:phenylalanine--tRNA ligase subunit beta [Candidatus Heimdallarchaeota archaeon]MCK4955621.1 phenylalanine--tRNA ligase subunit beta [Candidatus Heimdallarchaeota archaeon]